MESIVVLDIETTGFIGMPAVKYPDEVEGDDGMLSSIPIDNSKTRCNVLEVGYIIINSDMKVNKYGQFYFWRDDFRMGACDIHGLTEEFMREKMGDFNKNIGLLYSLVQNSVLIGKNSTVFDIPFIKHFINYHAWSLPEIKIKGELDIQKYYTSIYRKDVLKKTGIGENKKKGKLEDYCRIVGFEEKELFKEYKENFSEGIDPERGKLHAALYDAFLTMKLTGYLVENEGLKLWMA